MLKKSTNHDKKNELTLDEKILLITGKNSWQIHNFNGKLTGFIVSDGPHGLRKTSDDDNNQTTILSTAYPTLSCIANSWDQNATYKMGECIAQDCIEHDVDMILGPGINIKRTPLCGRNFEYFSEDPFLAGELASGYINGIQSYGVGACLKHFCANNREYDRLYLSSEVGIRALHEIYMEAFRIAIKKASPWAVMLSYNPVNGINASENPYIINCLRNDLKHKGLIMSDWFAVHDRALALKSGLDLEMPFRKESFEVVKTAFENGEISIEQINQAVDNILNMLDKKVKYQDKKRITLSSEQRHDISVDLACSSMVLLKNQDEILPINNQHNICVIGNFDRKPVYGGGGSAKVVTGFKTVKLSDELKKYLPECDIEALYPNVVTANQNDIGIDGLCNQAQALECAKRSDLAIVYVGTNDIIEAESYDREKICLSRTIENLINNVSRENSNTIVVLCAGSAVDVSAWEANVKGILFAGFAGEGVNEAIAKILVGIVNPSGKLAETFPKKLEDISTYDEYGDGYKEIYHDDIFVGYRYYEKEEKDVMYPFGFGLSYTNFIYANLQIIKDFDKYIVSYDITNNGEIDGEEISQLYISKKISKFYRPKKELKGFAKTLIKANETKKIIINLDQDSFQIYSEKEEKYIIENGDYDIFIGTNSKDIKLQSQIKIGK